MSPAPTTCTFSILYSLLFLTGQGSGSSGGGGSDLNATSPGSSGDGGNILLFWQQTV